MGGDCVYSSPTTQGSKSRTQDPLQPTSFQANVLYSERPLQPMSFSRIFVRKNVFFFSEHVPYGKRFFRNFRYGKRFFLSNTENVFENSRTLNFFLKQFPVWKSAFSQQIPYGKRFCCRTFPVGIKFV